MGVSASQTGSQTCSIGTEHTVTTTITAAGTYVFWVDMNNAANGDVFEFRAKRKVRSSDTQRNCLFATLSNVQSDIPNRAILIVEVPPSCDLDFSIKQTGGTGRAIPWSVDLL